MLFTAKTAFTRRGIFNFSNKYIWNNEDLHILKKVIFNMNLKLTFGASLLGIMCWAFLNCQIISMAVRTSISYNMFSWAFWWYVIKFGTKYVLYTGWCPCSFFYTGAKLSQRTISVRIDRPWQHISLAHTKPRFKSNEFLCLKSNAYDGSKNIWNELINASNFIREGETLFNIRQLFIKQIKICININMLRICCSELKVINLLITIFS